MKNHGKKLEELYPTMPPENKMTYPSVEIPAEVFEDEKCEIGEEYIVEVKVRIKRMDEYSYGCELIESEIESEEEEKKENE